MKFNNTRYGKPHRTVIDGIENKKETIFSNVDFFNGGENGYTTIEKISSEEFESITRELQAIGKMSPIEISNSLLAIMTLEKTHIKELEELAIKKVKEQFGIPDSVMEKVSVKLTIDVPQGDIYSKKSKSIECFSEEEKELIKKHVEKRKIQNALMMGAGFRAHTTFNSIKEDLDKIDPRLYDLYQKTMPNISFLIWQMPLENMMDQSFAAGVSKINKDKNGNVSANATAMIFPILLHETTKTVLELLFSNYIVDISKKHGEKIAKEIINQSDIPMEEVWMKRVGPTLWKYLHNIFDYIIKHDRLGDYKLISYLINKISLMEPEKFVIFMNNLLYNSDAALEEINSMIDEIEDKIEAYKAIKENVPKGYKDMNMEELNIELRKASEEERFEDAAEILKLIKKNPG